MSESNQNLRSDCSHFSELSTKSQTEKLSAKEKSQLKAHLLTCEECRKFHHHNNWLTRLLEKHFHYHASHHPIKLSEKKKKHIHQLIIDFLKGQKKD